MKGGGERRRMGGHATHQPPSRSSTEEIEYGYVAADQNATLRAVFEDAGMVEITVQGAQDFGLTNHGGVNNRVVRVRVQWNDAGRRSSRRELSEEMATGAERVPEN